MSNILAGRPNICLALATISFFNLGLNASNVIKIYEFDDVTKSFIPDSSSNSIESFEKGKRYIVFVKASLNLRTFLLAEILPFNWFGGKIIEFRGDSITAGSGTSNYVTKKWTTVFCHMTGAIEENHGVGGQCMQAEGANCQYTTAFDSNDIATKTPDRIYLFIAYGVNDISLNNAEMNVAGYKRDYQIAINRAIAKGWNPADIVMITPYLFTNLGFRNSTCGVTTTATQERVNDYRQAVIDLSKQNHCILADPYIPMLNLDGNAQMSTDGIHPDDQMAAYIAMYMATLNFTPQ